MIVIPLLAAVGMVAANPSQLNPRANTYQGDMTWKEGDFSGNACGMPATLPAVALNAPTFDARTPAGNPNANTLCGKKIRIKNLATGTETSATVVDRMTKQELGAIDVSPDVFAALGIDSGKGRCQVGWSLEAAY